MESSTPRSWLGGIPVIVDDRLAEGTILFIGKGSPRAYVQVDKMQTLVDAIDDDFLKRCGIITGLKLSSL